MIFVIMIISKKKISRGFCFPCKPPSKNKRNRKRLKKYLDMARELKQLWNIITRAVGSVGTALKCLERRLDEFDIRGKIDIIQTSSLLISTWLLRKVLETRGDLLPLRIQPKKITI